MPNQNPSIFKHIHIFAVLFVCLLLRLLFIWQNPEPIITPDTYGYYETSEQIFSQDFFTYIFNERRTPLYPLILGSFMLPTGHFPSILSAGFIQGSLYIVLFQSFIGLLGILIFYKTLRLLSFKPLFSHLLTLFIGCNILLFAWEKVLLTESLSIFFILLVTYFSLKTLKKPMTINIFILLVLFVLAFLLKPQFVGLPFIIFTQFFFNTKKLRLPIVISIFIFSLLIFIYTHHNDNVFDYKGITRNSEINLLGKIIKFRLNIEHAKNYPYFYNSLSAYRKISQDSLPYRFLEYSDSDIYKKNFHFNELQGFNRTVILANLGVFSWRSFLEIPGALLETSEFVNPPKNSHFLSPLFSFLFFIEQKILYLNLLILIALPFTFYQLLKNSSFENKALSLLAIITLYQIVTSVFLSYGEFGRLLTPAIPLIFITSFSFLKSLVKRSAGSA